MPYLPLLSNEILHNGWGQFKREIKLNIKDGKQNTWKWLKKISQY